MNTKLPNQPKSAQTSDSVSFKETTAGLYRNYFGFHYALGTLSKCCVKITFPGPLPPLSLYLFKGCGNLCLVFDTKWIFCS